jgi:hypothetical protein
MTDRRRLEEAQRNCTTDRKEKENALQEQGAEALDVRERAGDGEALGGRDPEGEEAAREGQEQAERQEEVGAPPSCYVADGFRLAGVAVVEATNLEIEAAIVVLKARAKYFGPPLEVSAYPFRPDVGWRQAALNFIRKNREEAAKGHGVFI